MDATRRGYYFNFIVFTFLGLLCFCYMQFGSLFAENNIKFPFLNFPVFIGEICLFLCFVVIIFKFRDKDVFKNKVSLLFILYFFFVVFKALKGYMLYGPLALRHAALFYYPAFVVVGYSFYDKRIFCESSKVIVLIIIIAIFLLRSLPLHSVMTYFLLAIVLSLSLRNKKLKFFFVFLLLLAAPYGKIFNTSRTMMLSNLLTVSFLIVVCFFISDVKNKYKLMFLGVLVPFVIVGYSKISNRNELASMVKVKKTIMIFNAYDSLIKEQKTMYIKDDYKSKRIFNADGTEDLDFDNIKGRNVRMKGVCKIMAENDPNNISDECKLLFQQKKNKQEILKKMKELFPNTSVESESFFPTGNILFRLFIWNDMVEEMLYKKPMFGLNFGKPLMPITLVLYEIGTGLWQRDGWVSAHNSFLNMIYRAGIVGVICVAFIFSFLIVIIYRFIKIRSLTGIFLCGIIVNWIIAANFLAILELPYTAIPFWVLFGMTYAYLRTQEKVLLRS